MQKNKKSFFEVITNIYSRLTRFVFFSRHSSLSRPPEFHSSVNTIERKVESLNDKLSARDINPVKTVNQDISKFEKLVYEIFIQRGYQVSDDIPKDDGMVDLILKMNKEITFVQYKDWLEQEVDVVAVEEFYNIINAKKAEHGVIITSGNFTPAAINFSLGKSLLLINGVDIQKMINVLEPVASKVSNPAESASDSERQSNSEITVNPGEMPELEPLCPICSREMIKRTAKKGKNAGNSFWGCSQFPRCRGVVN